MSQTIDNKIVEMQFNNQDFEKNVATSISTLDKLKAALNLDGAARGLDGIQASAEKVKFTGMSAALDTVRTKFSALDAVAFSALQRITNKAMDAGEKIIKSLSTDNIQKGWEKFGEKSMAVGTLSAQGYDMDTINEQLEKLNWYTDETSYNFTDMVNSIAKFTASGQDLETSVSAMEGIANWAALSGQNAQKASQAMYQLSQAMGAGVMRKEDYKSIQNVSMDTQEFRQKALDAAVALGTLKKTGEDTYSSLVGKADEFTKSQFTELLTEGAWFTSDVMMKVFGEYGSAIDQLYEYSEEHGVTASEAIDALGSSVDEFGLKAFKAAQEARTFGDVVDSIKDAVSTAWMNVFETIFGGYDESKKLWTDMANELYEVFATPVNNLQELLEGVFGGKDSINMEDLLGAGFEEGSDKLAAFQKLLIATAKEHDIDVESMIEKEGSFADSLEKGWLTADIFNEALGKIGKGEVKAGLEGTKADLDEIHELASEIIREGNTKWGTGKARIDALNAAGYDGEKVQAYVNLLWKLTNHDWSKLNKDIYDQADAIAFNAETLADMSDEQLKSQGYTEEEIEALRELAKAAEDANTPLSEFVNSLERPTGRELLSETIITMIKKIEQAAEFFGKVWHTVFPKTTSEQIYNIVKGVHDFVENLGFSNIHLNMFRQTLVGVLSFLNLFLKGLKSAGKNFFPVFGEGASKFVDGVLRVTSAIGRYFFHLDRAAKNSEVFDKLFKPIADHLSSVFSVISKFGGKVVSFIEKFFYGLSKNGPQSFGLFFTVATKVTKIVSKLHERLSKALGPYIDKLFGKVENSKALDKLSTGFGKAYDAVSKFVESIDTTKVADSIFDFLTKGAKKIESFVDTVKRLDPASLVKSFFQALHDAFFGATVSAGDFGEGVEDSMTASIIDESKHPIGAALKRAIQVLVGGIIKGVADVLNFSADNMPEIGKAISKFVGTIGTSFVNYFTTMLSGGGGIGNGQKIIGEEAKVIKNFVGNIVKALSGLDVKTVEDVLTKGAGIAVLVKMFKTIDSIKDLVKRAGGVFSSISGVLGSYSNTLRTISKSYSKKLNAETLLTNVKAISLIIVAISGSLFLLSKLKPEELQVGLVALDKVAQIALVLVALVDTIGLIKAKMNAGGPTDALGVLAKGLGDAAKKFARTAGIGIMIAGIGGGLLLLAKTLNELSKYTWGDEKGKTGFVGVVSKMLTLLGMLGVAVVLIQRLSGGVNVGTALSIVAIALAIKMLIKPLDLLGSMDLPKLAKGVGAIALIMGALSLALKQVGGNTVFSTQSIKTAFNFIALATALNMLIPAILVFANMKLSKTLKGISVVGLLMLVMGKSLEIAGKSKASAGAILAMTAAIVALSGAVILFSAMKWTSLAKGVGTISILLLALSKSVGSIQSDKGSALKIAAMAGTILVLVAALKELAKLDMGSLLVSATTLSAVMVAFGIAMKISNGEGGDFKNVLAMAAAIMSIAFSLAIVSQIDLGDALKAALTISAVLFAFVGALKLMSGVSLTGFGSILAMVGVIVALSASLYVLSKLPITNLLASATGLSAVLLAVSVALGIVAAIPVTVVLAAVLKLGIIIAAIVGVIEAIGWLMNNEGFANNATNFGKFIGNIIGGITEGISNSLTTVGSNLETFTASLKVCGENLSGINAESFGVIATIADSILTLAKADFLEAITKLIGGETDFKKFTDFIEDLGTSLKTYIKEINSVPYDSDRTEQFKTLATNLLELSKVVPKMGGLVSKIEGETGYKDFTTFIADLGASLKAYEENISDVTFNQEQTDKYTKLANDMAALTDLIPKMGGLVSGIEGETGYSQFNEFVEGLAEALITYVSYTSVIPLDKVKEKNTKKYTNLASELAEVATAVPQLNLLEGLLGETGFSTFIKQIPNLASALSTYVETIGGLKFNDDNIGKAKGLADSLTALNAALPDDGIIQTFTGGGLQLDTFGENIKKFGEGLLYYYSYMNESSINLSNIFLSNMVAQALAQLATDLETVKTGGWLSQGSLTGFGGELKSFGEQLHGYYEFIRNINVSKLDEIDKFLTGFVEIAKTVSTGDLADFKAEDMNEFGQALEDLSGLKLTAFIDSIEKKTLEVKTAAEGFIGGFINAFKDADTKKVSEAADGLIKAFSDSFGTTESVGDAAKNLIQGIADGLSSNSASVTSASASLVTAITQSISSHYDSFKAAGTLILGNIVNGFRSASYTANSAARSLALAIYNTISAYRTSMRGVGTSLASNFVNGLYSMTSSAYNAGDSLSSSAINGASGHSMWSIGYNLGTSLARGLRDALPSVTDAADKIVEQANRVVTAKEEIKSPSKVWTRYGRYMGQGLANGLLNMRDFVGRASESVANNANDAITDTVSKINDMISAGMDAQPVIRPVVDLSDVQTGMQAANSMFDFAPSMGVLTNLNAISMSMNRRNQNAVSNEDVVNAVNSLKDVLGENRNNYYVNGVTYADTNKDIISAIQTLIQFTKMEGRA